MGLCGSNAALYGRHVHPVGAMSAIPFCAFEKAGVIQLAAERSGVVCICCFLYRTGCVNFVSAWVLEQSYFNYCKEWNMGFFDRVISKDCAD